MEVPKRTVPNILITGTPGVGKSTLCSDLAAQSNLKWLNIGEIAKEFEFYLGYDEEYQCQLLDEVKVVDELEDTMENGGNIVDYHGCDFFPRHWFDMIFVLRTDNTLLYDRLQSRGYSKKKVEENVQCEIFQTLLEEAREAFPPGIVIELPSNSPEDLDDNVEKIVFWIESWRRNNS